MTRRSDLLSERRIFLGLLTVVTDHEAVAAINRRIAEIEAELRRGTHTPRAGEWS